MTLISRNSASQRQIQMPDAIQKSGSAQPTGVAGAGEAAAAKASPGTPVSEAPTQYTDAKADGTQTKGKGKPQGKDKFKAGLQAAQGREAQAQPEALKAGLQAQGQGEQLQQPMAGAEAADQKGQSAADSWKLGGGVSLDYYRQGVNGTPQIDFHLPPGSKVTMATDDKGNMMMSAKGQDGKDRYLYFSQDKDGNYFMRANQSDPTNPKAWSDPVPLGTKDAPALIFLGKDGRPVDGSKINNVNVEGVPIVPRPTGSGDEGSGGGSGGGGAMPAGMKLWMVTPNGGEWGMGGY